MLSKDHIANRALSQDWWKATACYGPPGQHEAQTLRRYASDRKCRVTNPNEIGQANIAAASSTATTNITTPFQAPRAHDIFTPSMSEETKRTAAAALRTITHARIACTNTIHELEVIDGLTDDWNLDNAQLAKDSLEIHLQAEFSAKEASTILENLTAIMTTGRMAMLEEWLCMELEVRRENAVIAAQAIIRVMVNLETAVSNDELGLVEMKRRAELIVGKLEKLKDTLVKLAVDWSAAIQASAKPRESEEEVFRLVETPRWHICGISDICSSPRATPGM